MQFSIIWHLFCAISFLFIIPSPSSAFYKYDSSFVFLNVHSKNLSPNEADFCVNFQQWRNRQLPSSVAELTNPTGNSLHIAWWNRTQNTNICLENAHNFDENEIVPVDYRTFTSELSACKFKINNDLNAMLDRFKSKGVRINDTVISASVHLLKSIGVRINDTAISATVNRLKSKGVRNVLFLMEKGKRNKYGTRDFLFSQFYNAEINDSDSSMSVFFVYNDTFQRQIKPLIRDVQVDFRFYRPQSIWPMDPAVGVLWLFAIGSILIGSIWAAFESKAKLMENVESQLKRSQSVEIAQMSVCQHLSVVLWTLVFVVIVITLTFFFRKFAVLGFCVLLWLLGICSVHNCVYSFLKTFLGEKKLRSLRECFGGSRKDLSPSEKEMDVEENDATTNPTNDAAVGPQTTNAVCVLPSDAPAASFPVATVSISNSSTSSCKSLSLVDRPVCVLSSFVFVMAFIFCTVWLIYREHHNAFYLLNTINFMVCIFAVKGSRLRSLRLITFLMLGMFVYDLFMVFGSTLITTDGCSVMMEVVTGVDCQQKRAASSPGAGKTNQPVAPIDTTVPEKIPLLFYVPMLADPMSRCFDVEVEREYKRLMLGLGDVIIPGQLIAFCFYVDVVKRSRFYTYGTISMIGYSLGMFSTFVALLLMETGQPALIYLVPCTLGPIFAWAFFVDGNGILGKMWRGEL